MSASARRRGWVGAAGALLTLGFLALPEASHDGEALSPASLVPPAIAAVLAVSTGRLLPALGLATVAGAVIRFGPLGAVPGGVRTYVVDNVFDPAHLTILGFTLLLLGMVELMNRSGATPALLGVLGRRLSSRRETQVGGAGMGCLLFFDDYANCMVVGPTLRPLFDRHRISRARLAFVVDSTAAPVAGLVPLSTWVGYEVGLLDGILRDLGRSERGFSLLLEMIPLRFYCMFSLLLVFVTALFGRELGAMVHAERRALERDVPPEAASVPSSAPGRPRDALVPLGAVLLAICVGFVVDGGGLSELRSAPEAWRSFGFWQRTVLGVQNGTRVLLVATAVGAVLAFLLPLAGGARPRELAAGFFVGVRTAARASGILLMAWALAAVSSDLGTGRYLAAVVQGSLLPWAIPLLTFVVAALIAFSTGTSWGTMAMLLPSAATVAAGSGEPWLVTVTAAAVLDGAIFGDHCSPISDTTLMSSIAAGCDHLEHVRTQLPYASLAALVALGCGYMGTLAGLPAPACWGLGLGVLILFVRGFGVRVVTRPSRKGPARATPPDG
jgi:Na+/H+ antiporter NhaC